MTALAAEQPADRGRSRAWAIGSGAWGALTGAAPHVLHHAGPLAGAAVLSGAFGSVLFFLLGVVLALPMLRRLARRTGSLLAPALAVVAFAAVFAVSTAVVPPLLSGSGEPPAQQPAGHDLHHVPAK